MARAAKAHNGRMHHLLCFGDSITWGEIDELGGGWVDRLKREFLRRLVAEDADEVAVHNLGLGGETTDGLRARFDTEFATRLDETASTVVVLAYGANDAARRAGRLLVAPGAYRANLAHCIGVAQAAGARVVLVNVTPVSADRDGVPNASGSLRSMAAIADYNAVLASLASEAGAPLVDAHAALEPPVERWLCADGLRPNAGGHGRLYAAVLRRLDGLLAR